MNHEEDQDRLVDLLLSELIGGEAPPDVRDRVLAKARMARPVVPYRPRLEALPVKRSRSGLFAIAAMVALLGVALVLIKAQGISRERTPVVTEFSGSVTPAGGRIMEGGSLQVGAASTAVLSYADGTVVEVGPDSSLSIPERTTWDRSKGLELATGSLEARVSPQPQGRPMILNSSHAEAQVIGTRLRFQVDEVRTLLEVDNGTVRFISRGDGHESLVESGSFAESGMAGFRHGEMAAPGIRAFVLMNAETDQPLRDRPLANGEIISLDSLPTRLINIRADYDGAPPERVNIAVTRDDRGPTGLPVHASQPHRHPPFFIAGDHWADGRPDDCTPWTPPPGGYQLTAEAIYQVEGVERAGPALSITVRFTR